MRKTWLLVAGLILVLVLVSLSACTDGGISVLRSIPPDIRVNLGQQEGIWVNGKGEVTAVPDVATLRLGIEAQETTVAEAQAKAAQAMDKVMAALTDNGVAKKDIQTQFFNIQKVTRWDKTTEREVVIGYRVSNVVVAKIRQMTKVGATIDAVAKAGGDLTRIDSISFSIDDPSAYYKQAREKAMADAKAKAEQMVSLAGIKLGKPTYITESTQLPPPIYRSLEKVAGAPAPMLAETPISPGELQVVVNVQVVYSILE